MSQSNKALKTTTNTSKALLTPIRRVGLSRKVRPSTFKSPLLTPEGVEFQRLKKEAVEDAKKIGDSPKFQFTPTKRLGLSRKFKQPRSNIEKLLTSPILTQPKHNEPAKKLFKKEETITIEYANDDSKSTNKDDKFIPASKKSTNKHKGTKSKKTKSKDLIEPKLSITEVTLKLNEDIRDDVDMESDFDDVNFSPNNITDLTPENLLKGANALINTGLKGNVDDEYKEEKDTKKIKKNRKMIIDSDEHFSSGDNLQLIKITNQNIIKDSDDNLIKKTNRNLIKDSEDNLTQTNKSMQVSDDDFTSNENLESIKKKIKKTNKNKLKRQISHKKSNSSQESIIKSKSKKTKFNSCLSLKKSKHTFEFNSDSEDDFVIKPKKVRKILSSKLNSNVSITSDCIVHLERLSSSQLINAMETNEIIETKQNCERMQILERINIETNLNPINIDTKEITNSQHIVINLEENARQFAEMSSPPMHIKSLRNEVNKLDKRVRDKEKQLAALQQSILYRKKHNVKDLEALTNIWKSGCQEAFRDLLIKLKGHSPDIDMNKLLKNMNIPSDRFSFDEEQDCFV